MNATIPGYAAIADGIRGLESYLCSKIKGQQHAISRVCSVLERGQFGLNPIDRPLGSFLFLGPTGVGKTALTLEFTRYLFGDNHIFRFDMSEFLHLDNVKLFMVTKPGARVASARCSPNTSGGFYFSTRSKRPTA
jgi:ATP-dependent Clp protease ATP-binding subunit ClpA